MQKSVSVRAQLLLGLVLTVLFSHLPVLYTLFYHQITGEPAAQNGVLELCKEYRGERAVLDGRWAFYWNQFVINDRAAPNGPDAYVNVPGYWSDTKLEGKLLPADGYASYAVRLQTPEISVPVTVWIPDFGSAYRAYIDGRLVSQSGVVSKSPKAVFTTPLSTVYPITLSEGEHELVIETATTRFSGLYKAPVMMSYDKAIQENTEKSAGRFALFGNILFSSFVLLMVYFVAYRKGLRSAWLVALVVCVHLRLMLLTEFFTFWQKRFFGGLSFEATNELLFLVSFALKFLMLFLYQEQFGVHFSQKEKIFLVCYYAGIFLVHFLTPYDFYNRYLDILIPAASFLLEVYTFCKIYFGKPNLQPYAMLVFWGTAAAVAGMAVDSYYANGNIYPDVSLVFPLCIAVYMMLLSVAFILRMLKVHREYEQSAARLEMARRQIAMQTEYYDALSSQMNEVRALRHDVRHFAATLALLAEEGRFDELRRFVAEYAELAEMEPLPVYCDNAVVNSVLGYYALRLKEKTSPSTASAPFPKPSPLWTATSASS